MPRPRPRPAPGPRPTPGSGAGAQAVVELPAVAERWLGRQLLEEARGLHHHPLAVARRRHHRVGQVELVLGPGAGHVEEPPLLLLAVPVLEGLRAGEAAVGQPDHEDGAPLQPLGLVDAGEDHLLVRLASLAHRLGSQLGEQRDLGEEGLGVGPAPRVLRQLAQVLQPGVGVDELGPQVGLVAARQHLLDGLAGQVAGGTGRQPAQHLDQRQVAGPPLARDLRQHLRQAQVVHRAATPPARQQGGPDRLRRGRPDPRRHLEAALQRQLVPGVADEAQVGQHVLHVGRLEEADAGADHEGDPAPRQLELDLHRVVVGPVEDRDLGERHPLVAQLQHPLRREGGLLEEIAARHQRRQWPVGPHAGELLLELLEVAGDRGVGQREDLWRRAVVDGEREAAGLRVTLLELEDVGEVGAAEPVDALGVVTDHAEVLMVLRQQVDDVALQPVGVLVLVDQQVAEPIGQGPAHRLPLGQQDLPVEQQVVEVHGVQVALALHEAPRHPEQLVGQRHELRPAGRHHLAEGRLRVDGHRDQVHQHVGLGEAARPHRQPAVGHRRGHHVVGVLAVEDRVAARVAERRGVLAQHLVRHVVEGAAGEPPGVDARHLLDPAKHLPGRLVGEGEQQDRLGRGAVVEEPGHPPGEGPGLARAGACHHQDRPGRRLHHGDLLVVEEPVVVEFRSAARGLVEPVDP